MRPVIYLALDMARSTVLSYPHRTAPMQITRNAQILLLAQYRAQYEEARACGDVAELQWIAQQCVNAAAHDGTKAGLFSGGVTAYELLQVAKRCTATWIVAEIDTTGSVDASVCQPLHEVAALALKEGRWDGLRGILAKNLARYDWADANRHRMPWIIRICSRIKPQVATTCA